MMDNPHLFICHASEDKEDFVRPLAVELVKLGIRVWYDEFSLKPGDSLSRSMEKGLRHSKFALLVLSKNFFKKKWSQWELDIITQNTMTPGYETYGSMIPIWHNIDSQEIASYSLPLANIYGIKSNIGVPSVAQAIYQKLSNLLEEESETESDYDED